MGQIRLNGLDGSQPLGAMAAFGLLRVCTELSEKLGEPRLAWTGRPDWKAVLHLRAETREQDLLDALVDRQAGREDAAELRWADDLKQPVQVFADFCREVSRSPAGRAAADFAAAFGSELAPGREGNLRPTPLYMTAGQQRFLAMARQLAASLAPGSGPGAAEGSARGRSAGGQGQREQAREAFREALFGPWRYQDRQHAFGWDPAAERLHALRDRSPTSEDPLGVRAAIWLAFEALPLFPSAVVRGRLRTAGFSPTGDQFSWPLWQMPLSLDALRSLLLAGELIQDPVPRVLRERGVEAVFRCERAQSGYYGSFRPAAEVPFARSGGGA